MQYCKPSNLCHCGASPTGASLPYIVTGKVATTQSSPYDQVIVSEPITNSTAAAAALMPADHDPNDPGDGQGLPQAPPAPQRGTGSPPLLMYRRVRMWLHTCCGCSASQPNGCRRTHAGCDSQSMYAWRSHHTPCYRPPSPTHDHDRRSVHASTARRCARAARVPLLRSSVP